MTGRALHRKRRHQCLPPAPGQAGGRGSGLHGPAAEDGQSWGSMHSGIEERKTPCRCPGSPQQHDAVRQAPHQQIWVKVLVYIHPPTQGVAEGGQARQSQLLSMDDLGAEVGQALRQALGSEAQGEWGGEGRRKGPSVCPPYLLGLSEEPPGTAVVDVHLAQTLERGSHRDVCGREKVQGHPGPWFPNPVL